MDSSVSNLDQTSELQSPRLRFSDVRVVKDEQLLVQSSPDTKPSHHVRWPPLFLRGINFQAPPWLGWLVTYAFVQFYFSFSRCLALKALVSMYGSSDDYTTGTKITTLGLGFLEDFVCTTYFVTALWVFDTCKLMVMERYGDKGGMQLAGKIGNFIVSWLLLLMFVGPFVTDMLLVVLRDMRFSLGMFETLIRERQYFKDAPISSEEMQTANITGCYVVFIVTLFALVRVWASWANLAHWNPSQIGSGLVTASKTSTIKGTRGTPYQAVALEEGSIGTNGVGTTNKSIQRVAYVPLRHYRARRAGVVFLGLVVIPALVVSICSFCSPLVAYAALNVTLNELLLHKLEPTSAIVTESMQSSSRSWIDNFIDLAEEYQQYGNDTLYRRTTGFHGELAFNVSIDNDNPPNVLIIGVESFRYRDSRYLVGQEDPSNLFKGTNLTITPNFDRWAKRGVALRNIWSSIPTSRSLESLLFAQVPYHSNSITGITGGREDVKLSGIPQLFLEKGYETYFTTGSTIKLDKWNRFLPTHGYNTVWDKFAMMKLAEKTLNITSDMWSGHERRAGGWGVHDDLSFEILGNLLLKKTRAQQKQMAQGKRKVPTFITHYTISSHEPYKALPGWYERGPQPDLSVMYEGEKFADQIKRYMQLRSFTDAELGKFMDRMEREGILNDTIVVIVGDHGQAPEVAHSNQHEESVTRVPAAIIAEGRLGDAVGLVIDDAVEQYDLLNTMADIVGLPKGGLEQNGVGRSLKRKPSSGKRAVFTNDPMRKMAIVRGHQRLRYDLVTDVMMLHDTELDYHMSTDLLPLLQPRERAEWEALRDEGRRIALYYLKRWDEKCLLAVNCEV